MTASTDEVLLTIARLRDETTGILRKINREYDRLDRQVGDVERKTVRASARMSAGWNKAMGGMTRRVIAFGAAFVGVQRLFQAVGDAREFRDAMSDVGTLSAAAAFDMDLLARAVRELAVAHNENEEIVARGIYDTISAGVSDAAEAVTLLDQSGRLAKAAVGDIAQSVDLLTTAINSYGGSVADAERLSDLFVQTVDSGKTTVAELASSFGSVAPLASQLGLSLEEVMAAIATLTAGGLSTSEAFTRVQATLTAFLKKGEQADKILGREFAGAMGAATLKAKGLQQAMIDLVAATGGSEDQLVKLTGRVEAAQAILALTGNQAETFAANIDKMNDAAGATEEAVGRKMNDAGQQAEVTFRALQVALSELGDYIIASFAAQVGTGSGSLEDFRSVADAFKSAVDAATFAAVGFVAGLQGVKLAAQIAASFMSEFVVAILEVAAAFDDDLEPKVRSIREWQAKLDKSIEEGADSFERLSLKTVAAGLDLVKFEEQTRDARSAVDLLTNSLKKQALVMVQIGASGETEVPADLALSVLGRDNEDLEALFNQNALFAAYLREAEKLLEEEQRIIEGRADSGGRSAGGGAPEGDDGEGGGGRRGGRRPAITPGAFGGLEAAASVAIEAVKATLTDFDEFYARWVQTIQQENRGLFDSLDAVSRNFTNAMVSWVDGSLSARDAFKDFARNVILDIIAMQTRIATLKLVGAALDAYSPGLGAAFTQGFGLARGGVLEGQATVRPDMRAASGTIIPPGRHQIEVNEKPGLREAVIPLQRVNGKLGVNAVVGGSGGGGGGRISMEVHIHAVDTASFLALAQRDPRRIAQVVVAGAQNDPALRQALNMGPLV